MSNCFPCLLSGLDPELFRLQTGVRRRIRWRWLASQGAKPLLNLASGPGAVHRVRETGTTGTMSAALEQAKPVKADAKSLHLQRHDVSSNAAERRRSSGWPPTNKRPELSTAVCPNGPAPVCPARQTDRVQSRGLKSKGMVMAAALFSFDSVSYHPPRPSPRSK